MRARTAIVAASLLVGTTAWAAPPLNLDRLDPATSRLADATIAALDRFIADRKAQGTLPLLTFGELYRPLRRDQRAVLNAIRGVDPRALQGSSRRLPPPSPTERFDRLEGQRYQQGTHLVTLDTQYLPHDTFLAYQRMVAAIQRDLGTRLLVESGYRSPAHQLYLFLFYLPKHGYSIKETNRFVALPGCSEHGSPARQAIDFINQAGINGEDHPEQFEALPEYVWLQSQAQTYGFFLTYPRGNQANTSFEPWHWHYEPSPASADPR